MPGEGAQTARLDDLLSRSTWRRHQIVVVVVVVVVAVFVVVDHQSPAPTRQQEGLLLSNRAAGKRRPGLGQPRYHSTVLKVNDFNWFLISSPPFLPWF